MKIGRDESLKRRSNGKLFVGCEEMGKEIGYSASQLTWREVVRFSIFLDFIRNLFLYNQFLFILIFILQNYLFSSIDFKN